MGYRCPDCFPCDFTCHGRNDLRTRGLRKRARVAFHLYTYFRGAEYPMRPWDCVYYAAKMAAEGWPRLGRYGHG